METKEEKISRIESAAHSTVHSLSNAPLGVNIPDYFEKVDNFKAGVKYAEECPSDELIMKVLNAVGYEEESWIQTVRDDFKRRDIELRQESNCKILDALTEYFKRHKDKNFMEGLSNLGLSVYNDEGEDLLYEDSIDTLKYIESRNN